MRKLLPLTLVAILLATAVLVADGAFAAESHNTAGESAAGDIGDIVFNSVTAGHFILWCGEVNDDSPTVDLSFSNADVEGTVENAGSFVTTAFKLHCWPVENTAGGNITATFDASENDGDRLNMMLGASFSGIATSSAVIDSDSAVQSGVTSHTSDSLVCSSSCVYIAVFATNRNATINGAGTCSIAPFTPTGADGFEYQLCWQRHASGGTYSLTWDISPSGFAWTNVWALNEAGAAVSHAPGVLQNTPVGRGGGAQIAQTFFKR